MRDNYNTPGEMTLSESPVRNEGDDLVYLPDAMTIGRVYKAKLNGHPVTVVKSQDGFVEVWADA